MTVAEAAALYLATHPGPAYPSRAGHINRFVSAHGGARVEDFPRALAWVWRDELTASFAPNTVRTALAWTSHLFNWAVQRDLCEENPFRRVERPKQFRRKRHLTGTEYGRLMAGVSGLIRHAIIIQVNCLFRKGELLRIQRGHVLLDVGTRGAIYLPISKNGEDGLVPLNTDARKAVDALLALPGEPGQNLLPMSRWQLHQAWDAARSTAGLADVWLHDLRRTGASWLAQNGTPIATVQEALRDKDINVTRRNYAHLRLQDVEAALDRLATA